MKYKKTIIGIGILLVLFVAYVGIIFLIENAAKKEINRVISELSPYAEVKYEHLSFNFFMPRVHLQKMILTTRFWGGKIKIDEGIIYVPLRKKNSPVNIHFMLNGIQFDLLQDDRFIKPYLKELGYETKKAHLECLLVYDNPSRELNVKRFDIAASDIGEAEFSLRLNNIDLATIGSLPKNIVLMMAMMSGVSIVEAEIRYKDDAFVKKIFQTDTRQKATPIQRAGEAFIKRIDSKIIVEKDPGVKNALRAIREFMRNPEKITIQIAPRQPVPLGRLYFLRNLKNLVEMLGIKVETSRFSDNDFGKAKGRFPSKAYVAARRRGN